MDIQRLDFNMKLFISRRRSAEDLTEARMTQLAPCREGKSPFVLSSRSMIA